MSAPKKRKPPAAAPPHPAPANDPPAQQAPPDLEPLFDNPELGTLVPREALAGGGFIEVYRYKRNAAGDAVGIPGYTLKLPAGATLDDIIANRQGGAYLTRAKNALGVVIGSARHNVEGPELEPMPQGGRQTGKVDSVQAGANFRMAIDGLTPQQQQMYLMQQDLARERQEIAENARRADAERHAREMERLEKHHAQSQQLLLTALTHRPAEEDPNVSKTLRTMLNDANKREDELRAKLDERTREAAELNVEVNSKDGDVTAKDLMMTLLQNAGEVGEFLKTLGFKPKVKSAAKLAGKAIGVSDAGGGAGGGGENGSA